MGTPHQCGSGDAQQQTGYGKQAVKPALVVSPTRAARISSTRPDERSRVPDAELGQKPARVIVLS
jgi:hypothetical protein